MISLILLLIGIALVIVNSNGILLIDQWIIYLTLGLSAGTFIAQLIKYLIVRRKVNKIFNDANKRFDKFKF